MNGFILSVGELYSSGWLPANLPVGRQGRKVAQYH